MQALLALILPACALYLLGGLLRLLFSLVNGLVSLALAAGAFVVGLGFSTLAFNQRTPQVPDFTPRKGQAAPRPRRPPEALPPARSTP